MHNDTQLVFIASHGHSGSTLLDTLIGSIPGCFSCGELQYLPWQFYRNGAEEGGVERQDICTCLKSFRDCPVWGTVLHKMTEYEGRDIEKDPFAYNISLLRSQRYVKSDDHSHRVLRRTYLELITRMQNQHLRRPFQMICSRQIKRNWHLFKLLSDATGAHTIVDSTKDILRFDLLRSQHPNKTKLIILYRDVRRVAASYIKRGGSIQRVCQSWIRYYQTIAKYCSTNQNIPILILSYEKLCAEPECTRKKLAAFLEIPPPREYLDLNTQNMHLVAGNPTRYKGKVTIRCDESWESVVSDSATLNYLKQIQESGDAILSTLASVTKTTGQLTDP